MRFPSLLCMLLLFGWLPCQRSDMSLVEVSQRAYNHLCVRDLWLAVYSWNICKTWYCTCIFFYWINFVWVWVWVWFMSPERSLLPFDIYASYPSVRNICSVMMDMLCGIADSFDKWSCYQIITYRGLNTNSCSKLYRDMSSWRRLGVLYVSKVLKTSGIYVYVKSWLRYYKRQSYVIKRSRHFRSMRSRILFIIAYIWFPDPVIHSKFCCWL